MPGWVVTVKRGMAITQNGGEKDRYDDGGGERKSMSKGGNENRDKNEDNE